MIKQYQNNTWIETRIGDRKIVSYLLPGETIEEMKARHEDLINDKELIKKLPHVSNGKVYEV